MRNHVSPRLEGSVASRLRESQPWPAAGWFRLDLWPSQTTYNFCGIDADSRLWQNWRDMSKWNVSRSTLIILGSLTFLMLLIVVLPDVDLPDTAFHGGTAPLVIHARATSGPIVGVVAVAYQWSHVQKFSTRLESNAPLENSGPNFRSILLCSIRC